MFSCSTCDRTYSSQTSLARHEHNHRKVKQHICEHCNVVFYRRDLLARHLRSHQRRSSSAANTDTNGRELRQRCHTACSQCRALKVKCSGSLPCENCVKINKPCHIAGSGSRVSHLAKGADDSETMADSDDVLLASEDWDSRRDIGQNNALPSPQRSEGHSHEVAQDLTSMADEFPAYQAIHDAFDIPEQRDDSMFGTASLDPLMLGSLSWPWHHEICYLPGPDSLYPIYQDWGVIQQDEFDQSHPSGSALDTTQETIQPLCSTSSVSESNRPISGIAPEKTTPDIGPDQSQLLEEIMEYASSVRSDTNSSHDHSSSWSAFSTKVTDVFHIESSTGQHNTPILEHFVHLYFEHFDQLWSTFSPQNLLINRLHPLLYLVLTSVGAMYSDSKSIYFGSAMHARVQTHLIEPLELRDSSYDAHWLAQARCISRMAALYFGQSRAISHAHHLGYLLAAQARRMDLFSAAYSTVTLKQLDNQDNSLSDQDRLTIWLRLESRRRLAFGIYRSEAYTSLLLQSKPLFYLGEIDLAFPSCDAVWHGEKMPPSVCLQLIDSDRTPGRDLYGSEIYHIAMDEEETLPPMDPLGHELLALGLLWPSWEQSRTPALLSRLCGEEGFEFNDTDFTGSAEPSATLSVSPQSTFSRPDGARRPGEIRDYDHLDKTSRKMLNLHSGNKQLLSALRKWEQSLPMVKLFARSQRDRTLLLSGLVVYHLIHLRLAAPATDLHELQYTLIDGRKPDPNSTALIARWLQSPRIRFAAERAVSIWSLIAGECAKPAHERVRFNLVAFAGLHDAAVLLWAYASTVTQDAMDVTHEPALVLRSRTSVPDCVIHRDNTVQILDYFGTLLDVLTPGKSSSFAQATKGLKNTPFPPLGST